MPGDVVLGHRFRNAGDGQCDRELRALLERFAAHATAEQFADAAHQVQAQAQAFGGARQFVANPVELIEDVRNLVRLEADTAINHAQIGQ